MQEFHRLLDRTLVHGFDTKNLRTGKLCRALIGETVRFKLDDGFPAITTKKLAFKSVVGELLGFFRGYTSAADFREIGCKIWDQNANETPAWLANPYRNGVDDLGRVYGAQWTDWRDRRIVTSAAERTRLLELGYHERMREELLGGGNEHLMERSINQLEDVLRRLLNDPSDRRLIVSGWNVGELDMMALPPCHMDYRFVAQPSTDGQPLRLSVVMTIRSWDLFLGGPFNIASTALFLSIMATFAGMTAHEVIIQATNAHIYHDHFDAVKQQLANPEYALPSLALASSIRQLGVEEIEGAFERIKPQDIGLSNYQHCASIPAPMAA